MADCWDNITVGMKVEVQNLDCDLPSMVYWIATVIKLAGMYLTSFFNQMCLSCIGITVGNLLKFASKYKEV